MRMGSRRLPKKNIRMFFGKPIFIYTLEAANKCGLFDEIIVSTESEEIRAICCEHGFELPFMRPVALASDSVQLASVVEHVLQEYDQQGRKFDNFCLLWATAPMCTATDIRKAHALLDGDTDAVISVTDFYYPLFSSFSIDAGGRLDPLFNDELRKKVSEQKRAVVFSSLFCWTKVSAFEESGTWIPEKVRGYWMPRHLSVDIDFQEDWDLAEFYYQKYFLNAK